MTAELKVGMLQLDIEELRLLNYAYAYSQACLNGDVKDAVTIMASLHRQIVTVGLERANALGHRITLLGTTMEPRAKVIYPTKT